jgi:hypothetical protein
MSTALGRVAAPSGLESTSSHFYFWVDRSQVVERTQIVTARSELAGRTVTFIGVVQEVSRRSHQRDVAEEAARYDGQVSTEVPFRSEGVTYAEVAILRTEPVVHAPPTEETEVFLATPAEAAQGYGVDRMGEPLPVGLLRNGGTQFVGPAVLDLDFLLGKNGGHLNVNGIAGLGTKSTLLLTVNWLLLRRAEQIRQQAPSDPNRLQIVSVIFNVKNYDLFYIDRWNKHFTAHASQHRADWHAVGVTEPTPFTDVRLFAPQAKGLTTPVNTGGRTNDVQPYSWALSDIIERRLFTFLFADEDVYDANFGGLLSELEEYLTHEAADGSARLSERAPQTFAALLEKIRDGLDGFKPEAHSGTQAKFRRRLKAIVRDGDGVLRRTDLRGRPLDIPTQGQNGPLVIDLNGIYRTPGLQRFVVAAVFHQIMQAQTARQQLGLRYLITLDELNRFAPKTGSDPITQQLETVASEGRSQGVILLGAQQQASLVKPRVIENAAVRAVGRSGALELSAEVWRFLSSSAKRAASQLLPEEKLLYQPSFSEPMLAKMPFPPFALSASDEDRAALPQITSRRHSADVTEL